MYFIVQFLVIVLWSMTTTTVLWPFFWDYPGEPVSEDTSGLYGTREINRGWYTDHL